MHRIFWGLGLLLVLAAMDAPAQTRDLSTSGQLLDRIVAVVNDGVVLQSELDLQVALISQRLTEQGVPLPSQNVLRRQVLERLIVQRIQLQRAERLEIRVTDEMLNASLARIAESNGISFDQMPAIMAAEGIDYAEYREEMRNEMTVGGLRQRDVDSRVQVSLREVEQFMEQQEKAGDTGVQYEIYHILIGTQSSATPEQLERARARAEEVYRRLLQGEDFSELAVAYSDGQNALEGGYIGWRTAGELPTIFSDIIPRMKAGDISEPIRSPSGLHIIQVRDLRGADPVIVTQVHARHILLRTDELTTDTAVRARLVEIRQRVIDGEDFAEIATEVSDDPGSAAEGGDLGWTGPGTFVPAFERALNQLEIDEISEPFRSDFGWHIVQLLGRRQHDSTEELARQKAAKAVRQRKIQEESEQWVRRLRDEAYVEVRL